LPGSPTVAIGIVTTPRFATGRTAELEPVLVVVVAAVVAEDDLPPKHPVAPSESAVSRPMSANRLHRMKNLPERVRAGVAAPRSSVVVVLRGVEEDAE